MADVHKFPCPGCGAWMEFDPPTGKLKCPQCAAVQDVPQNLTPVAELSLDDFVNADRARELEPISQTALQINCSGCGAVVTFEPPQVAGACAFCGANLVAQPKAADPLIAPHGVLPFAITRQQSTSAVQSWIAGLWFAPNDLKALARQEGMKGVYLPFWTIDAYTFSYYSGERGTTYREKDQTKIRWHSVSGAIQIQFDDVLIAGTKAVKETYLHRLEPWDLPQLKPYEPAYLAGFQAQRYQVTLENAFQFARQRMDDDIRDAVRRDIGGDQQRVHGVQTKVSNVTFKHLMLPVWIGAFRYQGKIFQVVVNARTGEVQGDRPYSVIKIILFVMFVLVVLFILSQVTDR